MYSFPAVQSVAKALALLAEMNRIGMPTIRDLHRRTGIPKPTIVRMLETLIKEGYVYKDHRMGAYQITEKAVILGSGFHGTPLAVEAARPWAVDLTRHLKWPTAVCTLDTDGVIVRYSTIADSPVSPFHSTIGLKLSLVTRALGRAYLAFCSESERSILFNVLDSSTDPENHFFDRFALRDMIAGTRRNGFAERDKAVQPRSSATVAVPVILDDRVFATLGVTYFPSAVAPSDRYKKLVVPLKEAAANIERALRARLEVQLPELHNFPSKEARADVVK